MNRHVKVAKTLRQASASSGLAPIAIAGRSGKVAARYAIAVTPAVAALIDSSDPDDPIARQFVPECGELNARPKSADPIGDHAHSPSKGSSIAIPTACC
jgi:lysine 2,3-aminomutase